MHRGSTFDETTLIFHPPARTHTPSSGESERERIIGVFDGCFGRVMCVLSSCSPFTCSSSICILASTDLEEDALPQAAATDSMVKKLLTEIDGLKQSMVEKLGNMEEAIHKTMKRLPRTSFLLFGLYRRDAHLHMKPQEDFGEMEVKHTSLGG